MTNNLIEADSFPYSSETDLDMDQTPLQRGDNGLRAIARIQPHQNHADMALDGGPCNAELACNLAIGFAVCEQPKHFTFAVTEV